MRKLIILLDLDDVLNNQNELWLAELNHLYNKSVRPEDITSWDITKAFSALNESQIYEPVTSGRLVWKMTAPHDAVEYTNCWHNNGHTLFIVTATHTSNADAKVQWLYRNYPWFNEDRLIITRYKQLIMGDVLIDDGLHNLLPNEYISATPGYTKVCLDKPWNRLDGVFTHGIHRIQNFAGADSIIQELEKRNVY